MEVMGGYNTVRMTPFFQQQVAGKVAAEWSELNISSCLITHSRTVR